MNPPPISSDVRLPTSAASNSSDRGQSLAAAHPHADGFRKCPVSPAYRALRVGTTRAPLPPWGAALTFYRARFRPPCDFRRLISGF